MLIRFHLVTGEFVNIRCPEFTHISQLLEAFTVDTRWITDNSSQVSVRLSNVTFIERLDETEPEVTEWIEYGDGTSELVL